MNEADASSKCSEVAASSLKFLKQLGSGSQGDTFVVQYNGLLACAKIYREIGDFTREMDMLEVAKSSRHSPRLLGACTSLRMLLMELAPGQTLQSLLKSRPCRVFVHKVMIALGKAIEHLHSVGVIHNDLKFDNIMVAIDNSLPKIILIDFGWSTYKGMSPYAHVSEEVITNFRHVSPKLAGGGSCDNNTDNYSFGVMLRAVANDSRCPLFSLLANILTMNGGTTQSLQNLLQYIRHDYCRTCEQSCHCGDCRNGQ